MLNEYDEWHCDECGKRKDRTEIVFIDPTPGHWGKELCDECYEEEE